jgi:hypothetical protein
LKVGDTFPDFEVPEPHVEGVPNGRGVQDMALAEAKYPGWLGRLLTHPVEGLDNYGEMIRLLAEEKAAIKVFVEVKDEAG